MIFIETILRLIIKKCRGYFIKRKYKSKNKINIFGKVYLNNMNIMFGKNVSIYQGVQIFGNGSVILSDNVSIGKDTIIFSNKKIYIGANTSIAGQCYIIDSEHGTQKDILIKDQNLISDELYIGEDVWIGAGCKILKGAYVSDGSVIGAQSLVRSKTEDYSINVGIPSKLVKFRK